MLKSLLEAMACGIPPVASNLACILGTVKNMENGLVFEKDNPRELAGYIIQLGNNRNLRERLGKSARKTAVRKKL